jgi:hypothetical protein
VIEQVRANLPATAPERYDDSAMDSRGQRSRDRAFDFNLFASELFSLVDVEKTYQAAQNEGGMAGTVACLRASPLIMPRSSRVPSRPRAAQTPIPRISSPAWPPWPARSPPTPA